MRRGREFPLLLFLVSLNFVRLFIDFNLTFFLTLQPQLTNGIFIFASQFLYHFQISLKKKYIYIYKIQINIHTHTRKAKTFHIYTQFFLSPATIQNVPIFSFYHLRVTKIFIKVTNVYESTCLQLRKIMLGYVRSLSPSNKATW